MRYWVCHLTFFFQLMLISWMVTLSSCLIWQIISFIIPQNVIEWVFVFDRNPRSTYRRCQFWQINHLFRWRSFWYWRICKQAKLWHLRHRKPERIYWKADAPKTSHCLVRILVHFSTKMSKARQCRSLSGHVEKIFVYKNWRGGYWKHLVSTGQRFGSHSRSYTRCFAPCS